MKLQEFAAKYNCTLSRACMEILVPNGHKSRKWRGRITFRAVCPESAKTPELKKIALAYSKMKGFSSYVKIHEASLAPY